MAAGRRGPQALSLKILDPPPSLTRTRREAAAAEHKHTPDELHGMVEDMITLLEGAVQPELRKGRYPDRKVARRVSEVVKAVAPRTRRPVASRREFAGMLVGMAEYVASGGEFNRDTNYITTRITADGRDGYPVEPGRYRLVVARACPWANRAIIVRGCSAWKTFCPSAFAGPPTTSAAGPSTSTPAASTRC